VTRTPDFDELVGNDLDARERSRLRTVHDLLVTAGPPPELSPELEAGPDILVTYRRRPGGRTWRRPALLAAALLVLAAIFVGGYISGNRGAGESFEAERTLPLHGTTAAPNAAGTLAIGSRSGPNWPMLLVADRLPALKKDEYYEMWLTRKGERPARCGGFLVQYGEARAYLNAPYRLEKGAGWKITRQKPGEPGFGEVVLTT
jgi:Anti-sigma-K factor rskA